MKNVYIYCEGQTEEAFVNGILFPYFYSENIMTIPIICQTSRRAGKKHRGGAVNYEKIRHELTLLSKEHRNEHITTMFDYYGMPENTPEIDCSTADPVLRMKEIGSRKLKPGVKFPRNTLPPSAIPLRTEQRLPRLRTGRFDPGAAV